MKKKRREVELNTALATLTRACVARGNQSDLLVALAAVDPPLAACHLEGFAGDESQASQVLGYPIREDGQSTLTMFEELIRADHEKRRKVVTMVRTLMRLSPEQSKLLDEIIGGKRTLAVKLVDD